MKVLVVGLGSIGQRHVRNLRTLLGDSVHIGAVRQVGDNRVLTDDLHVLPGEDVHEKYAIRRFDDLQDALADGPDVVFVTNPSYLHVPVALAAAHSGCHLFIEKPLSHTCEGIEELIEVVERNHLIACVGYQLRFHPCLRLLVETVEQQRIGRVVAARFESGEYLPGWHPYEDYRQSYAARREYGGGVILSQIHDFDCVFRLFGVPSRVFALGGHLSRLEVDVEDIVSILLECRMDGRAVPVSLHQDYVQQPPSRIYELIGDRGKVIADLIACRVRFFDENGRVAEERAFADFQRNQLFLDELQQFLLCLKGQQTPLVSLQEAAESLRMALAARQSLERGRVVELPSLAVPGMRQ